LAVGVTAACGSREESAERTREAVAPVAAQIAAVEATAWPSTYEAGAVVRARQTAVVSARVVAPILEVRVAAGDRVRRGQTIVVLDGRELQAQATRASAGASGSGLALQAAQAEKQAAESALTLARLTHERVRGLHAKDSATKQELDEATAVLAGAEARVAGATARVAEAQQGIAGAKAGEEAAAVGVSYTVLTAPFDGLVSARHADPGSLAAPGMPLLTLDDATGYRLEARIDESHAQLVSVGAEADVRLDRGGADPAAWRRARIAEFAALDPARHSFLIKLDLPRDMPDVRSGQFGRVRLLGPARDVLSVPAGAIVRRGQLTFVFALDASGAARLRMVSVGESAADRVEVLAGLAAGDRVVVNPPAGLEDGQPITGAAGAAK
jgi:multidrug efflux pump subunit AcrA (membrane-fusion protein)